MLHRLPIASIDAHEILDSRGNPTLSVTVALDDGTVATASVPSGASKGTHEVVELRDGDEDRYDGKGVQYAVQHVCGEISRLLCGYDAATQLEIDGLLIEYDATLDKARLGGNAILGVSIATARAAAASAGEHLHAWLAATPGHLLPMPFMNVLNGGKHADSSLDFQEFMIVPVGASSFAEAVRYGAQTYSALRDLLFARGHRVAIGDEGGFAPRLENNEQACELIVEAIEHAGFRPGMDIAIALDVAASSFGSNRSYDLFRSGTGSLDRAGLLALYGRWIDQWPIISIEDGFAEDDWNGFIEQTETQGDRIQIVGDDLLVTSPQIIRKAIARRAGNAALIKPNQVGTVSETLDAVRICHEAGWRTMVSHRSGETNDDFIADLAVAINAGQIKAGAPCRGERVGKYNRLIGVERGLGSRAEFRNPFSRS